MRRFFLASPSWLLATVLVTSVSSAQTPFSAELHGLLKLHNGSKTDLEAVERVGADMLKRYEEPQYQAQIYYTLAHIHAQAAMREPAQIEKYGQLALDSKLITPGQRATIYSYLCSAIEVQQDKIKDFPERRRAAMEPLMKGLGELAALKIPEKEPELPPAPVLDMGEIPGGEPRPRAAAEAYQRARDEQQRIRDLIFRRKVLNQQVQYLYGRPPENLDELRELATKAVGKEEADKLAAVVATERDRIEKARQAAIEKAKQEKAKKSGP